MSLENAVVSYGPIKHDGYFLRQQNLGVKSQISPVRVLDVMKAFNKNLQF